MARQGWIAVLATLGAAAVAFASDELPAQLTQPTTVVTLAWGAGPREVRNSPESGPGEGAPTSFLVDRQGRLCLLDAANYRILRDLSGAGLPPVDLMAAGLPGPTSYLVDFDVARDGDFVVLDQVAGTVLRFSPQGRPRGRFGVFRNATELAVSPDGRILVRDTYVPAVNVFSNEGKFLSERRGEHWTVHVDSRGRQYKAQLFGVRSGIVSRADAGSARAATFAAITPVAPGWDLAEVRLAGLDAAGNVYVKTTEARDEKLKFGRLIRFDPSGKKTAELAIPRVREFFSTLPRFYRVTPTGKVLTFSTHEQLGYSILELTFPR
ncbi:MAG: hypothetical protein HY816_15800 [Candidatus Wallbacteria bacterium]|nr:hypothetical protein [Candidatus Wallbacteria bacterium]